MRDGLVDAPQAVLRELLGVRADAQDHTLARALVEAIARGDLERLSRAEQRGAAAGGALPSLAPVASSDRSFLGRLKVESEIAGEQSVAAMGDVLTLLAVLRAGSLLQRRAAARRLAERLNDRELAPDDKREIQEVVAQLRDVEIAYDLLACHGLLANDVSREAQRTRREVLELAAQLEREVVRHWEGDVLEEPFGRLSGDARAQLMLHARDLNDPLLWHVAALIEGAAGSVDPAAQRTLLSSVRYASDPRLVPSLVSLLDADDSRLVIEAARALGRIEDARVWAALVAAYERSVIDLERLALGTALGRHGDVRAAEYVRAQLRSEDEHVRTRALEGLRTVGTEADVPAVLTLLRGGDPVLATKAAHTLGRISDGRGLSELSRLASSAEVSSLRAAAEDAMHQIAARMVLRGELPTEEGRSSEVEVAPRESVELELPALGIRLRALRAYLAGRLWQLLGAQERALGRLEAAIACWPDWAMPMIVAGVLYAAREEHAQALTLFRRALQLSRADLERNPIVMRHVARCFLRRAEQLERDGRLAIARGLLEEVLLLDLRRASSSLRFEISRRHEALRQSGAG